MKKYILLLMLFVVLLVSGCQNPDHRDAIILVTRIAENHISMEQTLAEQKCAADGAAVCEKAEKYAKWVSSLTLIEGYATAATPEEAATKINEVLDFMIAEMVANGEDPRTQLYIADIRVVVEMMIARTSE